MDILAVNVDVLNLLGLGFVFRGFDFDDRLRAGRRYIQLERDRMLIDGHLCRLGVFKMPVFDVQIVKNDGFERSAGEALEHAFWIIAFDDALCFFKVEILALERAYAEGSAQSIVVQQEQRQVGIVHDVPPYRMNRQNFIVKFIVIKQIEDVKGY